MKTFKALLAEIEAPQTADEREFKRKHTIQVTKHPEADEEQHSPFTRKSRDRFADYKDGGDVVVYEGTKEDELEAEFAFQLKKELRDKVIDEAAHKIAVELSENHQMAAIGRKLQQLAPKEKNDTIANAMANLGDHLESYGTSFGAKNMKELEKKTGLTAQVIKMLIKRAGGSSPLAESTIKSGSLKLDDGSSVTVSAQDAKLLTQMLKDLNPTNRKRMTKVLKTDKAGFEEIVGFAREAL